MKGINKSFSRLSEDYLFTRIGKKICEYEKHGERVINLSIGDNVFPLGEIVTEAAIRAATDMKQSGAYCGYPPVNGYLFLREAVSEYYDRLGIVIDSDEVYISDGAKSDLANFTDLYDDVSVVIQNPIYPVYSDAAIIAGFKRKFAKGSEGNGFLPMPNDITGRAVKSLIYLCSPNNPTGECYDRGQLTEWIEFAIKTRSLLVFDSSYEAYISDESKPHSVFEIENSRFCAVEIGSLSKSFGFTGLRCSYTIIPHELEHMGKNISKLWQRRQSSKFNGVAYITQRAAQAAMSTEGASEHNMIISIYKDNATRIKEFFKKRKIQCFGGSNSPYVWVKTPINLSSAQTADDLLKRVGLAVTPGLGFGVCGEGYIRLSGFSTREDNELAIEKLNKYYDEFDHFYKD